MKKLAITLAALLLLFPLSACQKDKPQMIDLLTKAGVEPYAPTAVEQTILEAGNLTSRALVVRFLAPNNANRLVLKLQERQPDGSWLCTAERDLLTKAADATVPLRGNLGLRYEDGALTMFHQESAEMLNQFEDVPAPTPGFEAKSWANAFFKEGSGIIMNQEIPIAVQVCQKEELPTGPDGIVVPRAEAYPDAAAFSAYDYTRVITLSFVE